MVLMIDANIILDVLMKREPFYEASSIIWKRCEVGTDEGYISVLSFANLVYVMRRQLTPEQIRFVLSSLRLIFHFEEMTETDLMNAAAMKWDDFEDAIQYVTARKVRADYIVTRNVRDFESSGIPAVQPSDYIAARIG